jgi:hypothetical protein
MSDSISLRDLALRLYNMGEPVKPIQQENGPLDALAISAGAAADSGIDQAKRAYLMARLGLAYRWQGPEAEAAIQRQIAELDAERIEKGRLYEPLRRAYPFTTTGGEAVPAFMFGRGAAIPNLKFNMTKTYFGEAARSIENSADAPVTLRELAARMAAY